MYLETTSLLSYWKQVRFKKFFIKISNDNFCILHKGISFELSIIASYELQYH